MIIHPGIHKIPGAISSTAARRAGRPPALPGIAGIGICAGLDLVLRGDVPAELALGHGHVRGVLFHGRCSSKRGGIGGIRGDIGARGIGGAGTSSSGGPPGGHGLSRLFDDGFDCV